MCVHCARAAPGDTTSTPTARRHASVWRMAIDIGILLGSRSSGVGRGPRFYPVPVMTDASLEVAGVTKRFGAHRAVDDVSFRVRPGTITGLIGPNGAGKTTMFNLIAGALRPSAGRISLGD